MTGPSPASRARRQTWTIIGTPAISASGFPGRRVAARREGMTTIGFIGGLIGGTISGGGYFPVWCATRGRPSSGKAAQGLASLPGLALETPRFAAVGRRRLVPGARLKQRSEERRVGKECVSKCIYRRSPYH